MPDFPAATKVATEAPRHNSGISSGSALQAPSAVRAAVQKKAQPKCFCGRFARWNVEREHWECESCNVTDLRCTAAEAAALIDACTADLKADNDAAREKVRLSRAAELDEALGDPAFDPAYQGMHRASEARLGCGCVWGGRWTHECDEHEGLDAFMACDAGDLR